MKQAELKPFEELRHTDQIIRLDGFGGVQTNLYEYDNPLLECFFTPINQTDKNDFIPQVKNQFRAGFAVGYLPGIFIGQYFRKGKRLPLKDWPNNETITFDIDISSLNSVKESSLLNLDLHSQYLADNLQENGYKNGVKILNGKLIETDNKNKYVNCPETVAINEIELIRYYLTNSSHSCKNIFTGAFADNQLYSRVINNLHEEEDIDPVTGFARLVYKHGYKAEDAPALARILFEPNNLGLKAARRVHNKIAADKLNSHSGIFGFPRTYFPFTGPTTLKLSGRRLKTKSGYVFLAYRIISCSALFPFKNLSFCDEIEPGGSPAPADAPVAFSSNVPVKVGDAHESDILGSSKSKQAPRSDSAQIHIALSQREYPSLATVSLVREKLKDSTHNSAKKSVSFIEGLTDASTGAGTSGESSAARQSLSEPIVKNKLPADLTTFVEIINCLRIVYPQWSIETILINNGAEVDGEWVSYFPEVPCEVRRNIMRQFSFMDEYKTQLKSFMCVQITIDDKYLYLFESERRMSTSSELSYKDKLPILLVWADGYVEKLPDDFLAMIKQTVKNKTWPNHIEGLNRDYTVHGLGAETSEDMAVRVAQLIFKKF